MCIYQKEVDNIGTKMISLHCFALTDMLCFVNKLFLALFSLSFDSPLALKHDIGSYPIYLALSMNEYGTVKCKPQNLIVNLQLKT